MSGHSKWSKVKHQKATTDVVKARAFTKASRAITVAVREGGGISNPDDNFKLRLAIEKAKEVNMPKENIDRAILKGKGEGGETFESLLYEGYGPFGTAFLIEAATENRQRSVSQIKNVLEHNNGVLANQGAVSYQFIKIAMIILTRPQKRTDDELFTLAADTGAQDVQFYDDSIEITTDVSELEKVRNSLEQQSVPIETTEIMYKPTMPISIDPVAQEQVERLIESLIDLDDVQKVHTNIHDV